jgi:hypothetical protein
LTPLPSAMVPFSLGSARGASGNIILEESAGLG